jgi:hypothetical protein
MYRTAILLLIALSAMPASAALIAPDRVYQLDFDNLTCGICRKNVKDTLLTLSNVKSVDYDLKAYICYVTMNGSATLTATTVEDAFKGSKYVFRGISEVRTQQTTPAPAPAPAPAPPSPPPPPAPAPASRPANGSRG